MANGIPNEDLLDLTRTTLENLPDMDFQVALDYQQYPVCNQWFAKDKVQVDSGTSIKRNILLDTSGNARHVRLYQKTPINVADVQQQITAPWCQVQTHYSIERREALRNRKPARYIPLIKSRRLDAMLDLANLLEERAWLTPASSSDDLNPRGILYWLSFREEGVTAATDDGGFSCYTIHYQDGATTTSKGGIDGSTYDKWRNWGAVYTAIDADFVRRMRKAFHAVNFKSPMLVKDLSRGPAARNRIYMGLSELSDYEDLVTSANDNLGRDLDPFHGMTTFRRVPVIHTPQLDGYSVIGSGDTANTPAPVIGVNHAHFYPMVLEGDWLRESEPMKDVEQHNVQTVFVDSSYQYFCNNVRQAGFVLHTTLTA